MKKVVVVVVCVLLIALLAGCGGDDSGDDAGTTAKTQTYTSADGGYTLQYPTFREGYAALLKAPKGG